MVVVVVGGGRVNVSVCIGEGTLGSGWKKQVGDEARGCLSVVVVAVPCV